MLYFFVENFASNRGCRFFCDGPLFGRRGNGFVLQRAFFFCNCLFSCASSLDWRFGGILKTFSSLDCAFSAAWRRRTSNRKKNSRNWVRACTRNSIVPFSSSSSTFCRFTRFTRHFSMKMPRVHTRISRAAVSPPDQLLDSPRV